MPHSSARHRAHPQQQDRVPTFVHHPVTYNHLPRHPASAFADGSIQDRIGWVILHPDLRSIVNDRLHPYPTTTLWVSVYRDTAHAAAVYPYVGRLAHQGELNSWDASDNARAYFAAQTGHYGVLHIADIAINQIANPTIIRLLRDLLPSRHQHLPGYRHPYSSPTRTTNLYDIPTPSNTNRTKGNAWGSPSATGGWGTPPSEWTTDPWAITKPDTPPPSDQEAEDDQCSGRAGDAPPPLISVHSAGPADRSSSPQPQSVASSSLLAFVDEDGLLPTRRDRPLNHHDDDEAPRKTVTWVDRALGAIMVASRGAQP
ncbi:hypothetical protein L227DRAFT_566487 [Lentinus tigrinus ALCF2SS1-6]|uniref:Uncharacterized protein n=1 Tax=Lentinus tigrinus ALCF2SS1-6 TaxID=1328759 RepID=A0A5C2RXH7_9APHY|nr:hypothetical protein L227DRAFT_566487 [Lentinus tigrinus ALCF2SS1-6]